MIKNSFFLFLTTISLFISCKKDNSTNIKDIDNRFSFLNKDVLNFDEDSLYTYVELFYNTNLEDSVYVIGSKQKKDFLERARGWTFNGNRVGDWYFEKKLLDDNIVIDSLLNYTIICDKNLINTIKKFKKNEINKAKGYFHEVKFNKEIQVNDTLDIKIDFNYDKDVFDKISKELYFFNPPKLNDYCNHTNFVVDSFPIINNSTKMSFILSKKEKVKLLGYYYLRKKEKGQAIKVITEIDFEVK